VIDVFLIGIQQFTNGTIADCMLQVDNRRFRRPRRTALPPARQWLSQSALLIGLLFK
jgi:hypothetical protein